MNRHASTLILLAVLGLATTIQAKPPGGSVRVDPRFTDLARLPSDP